MGVHMFQGIAIDTILTIVIKPGSGVDPAKGSGPGFTG